MGNAGQKLLELGQMHNACQMIGYVNQVIGIERKTRSVSETWIVQFRDAVTYEDKATTSAFIKLWIDDGTETSLADELLVYRTTIRDLLDFGVCPNFVKYYAAGRYCSYDNIVDILHNENNTKDEVKGALNRNIQNLITYKKDKEKPPPHTPINKYLPTDNAVNMHPDLRFTLMVNEDRRGDKQLGVYLTENDLVGKLAPIIFQAIVACYAMKLSRISHGDLHMNNIFISTLEKDTLFHYTINHKLYTFTSRYMVRLFDFDRVRRTNITPNRDALVFTSALYISLKKLKKHPYAADMQALLSMCTDAKNKQYAIDMMKQGAFCQLDKKTISPDDFRSKFKTIEDMVLVAGKTFETEPNTPLGATPVVFARCNPDMFNDQGRIVFEQLKTMRGFRDIARNLRFCRGQINAMDKRKERMVRKVEMALDDKPDPKTGQILKKLLSSLKRT